MDELETGDEINRVTGLGYRGKLTRREVFAGLLALGVPRLLAAESADNAAASARVQAQNRAAGKNHFDYLENLLIP